MIPSKSKSFCIYPFTHLNVKANGHLTVCNRCQPLEKITSTNSLEKFWSSEKVSDLRKRLANGERPQECIACWQLEDSGSRSYRQEALEKNSPHYRWLEKSITNDQFQTNNHKVKEIELRFGNLCNLKCKMCSPKFSSKWEKELQQNADLNKWISSDHENFDIYDLNRLVSPEDISLSNKAILKSLDSNSLDLEWVMFSGGEPLLQKEHYQVLEKLLPNAHNIVLEYTTNLNYLNFEKYDALKLWKNFKKVYLKISLDADPLIYEYVRSGGNIHTVEENIERIRTTVDSKNFSVIGTCTTSLYNIERLPEIITYFINKHIYVHTSLVEYPSFLSPQVFPAPIKEVISKKISSFTKNLSVDQIPNDPLGFIDQNQQLKRSLKWTTNCLNYMNGEDLSHLWNHFLKFNSFFDKNNEQLFKFYPDWKKFT